MRMVDSEMTSRERFYATFQYGEPDRVFLQPHWVFQETLRRWQEEGLPADVDFCRYFDFDPVGAVPLRPGYTEDLDMVWPRPETRVVETSDEWQIIENELGGKYKIWTDREIGMSQWLEFPVRDRESWEHFTEWLDPEDPTRYPDNWEEYKQQVAGRDYPLGIQGASFYGWIRDWVGMENLAMWYYDRPGLVADMVNYVADFSVKLCEKALAEIPDIDFVLIWEDMCMKTGSLISPQLFRQFHLEPMQRAVGAFREAGVPIIMLDSDGRVDELLPLWLEAGVDLVYPLERASDCDPVRYREEYGEQLLMIGGMDKRALREGMAREAIEQEVRSKGGLIAEGGYSPMIDHAVPPDVPLENFEYYLQVLNEVCTFR